MTSKLPKAVRGLIKKDFNRLAGASAELTRAFYAGALFGVKVAELMIEKKLPKSRAEIRRMEKEAKNA